MTKEEIKEFNRKLLEKKEKLNDPEYRKQLVIERMENMKPFNKDDNALVPDVPQIDDETYKNYVIPAYIRCGAIPKSELIDGKKYYGSCRNASIAVWYSEQNCFIYEREKFGSSFQEKINHFEDDNKFDLFVPLKEI